MSLSDKTINSYYSRDYIQENYPLTPFILTGTKRIVFLSIYVCLSLMALTGIAYSFAIDPVFCLLGLIFCYIADNFLFAIMHLRLHALFIELPEKHMNVSEHHAFIHHYRNTKIFHETWLETRISYFIDPRSLISGMRMFVYKIFFTGLTSIALYFINPIIGITYFSGVIGVNLLQGIIHEWYHNPIKNRKKFYNPILYTFINLLEKLKIASSKKHLKHHLHNLSNLEKANVWLDLYFPAGELWASKVWKYILSKYTPGEYNMTSFMTRIYEYAIALVLILLPLTLVGTFYLI